MTVGDEEKLGTESRNDVVVTQEPSAVEKGVVANAQTEGLQRPLKPRHMQMIAIGGVIGTGLFLGTAGDLENGGPAGLLIGYCVMASLLFSVMVVLGEMVSKFPIPGGQFALAGRFVAPELGFAMGVLYWYNYIIVLPAEISAAAVLISYWTPAGQADSTCTTGVCNNAMWVGLMLIVVWAINFGGTRVFGEMEFWFCSIKPQRSVPRAIKGVWIRLVLFYLCSVFLVREIGLLVSPSDPSLNLDSTAAKSPFVIAIKNAGISVLPSIVNAALLTSAWSAGCADLFVSSRTLYGLYTRGQAPRFLGKTRKDGLPWVCVLVGAAFSLLSFMAANNGKAGTAFGYYGLSICILVLIFGGFSSFIHTFDTSAFITTYFPIPFFAVLFFGYKFYHKTKIVKYTDQDFISGSSSDIPSELGHESFWKKVKDSI
ncbi:putative arginine permease [Phaeomoniella chlamydospora]|uniref:Putative arginine permease n=1 Tax=Phaeomoniella chlamydospora TaxID=158046 RepID=A0A0G2GJL5_PHACM|nr:putative arginine permease [Phaeomoniella chlamydospora]